MLSLALITAEDKIPIYAATHMNQNISATVVTSHTLHVYCHMVVRRQQMWRVSDCKIIAGELVATQHKPLFLCAHAEEEKG